MKISTLYIKYINRHTVKRWRQNAKHAKVLYITTHGTPNDPANDPWDVSTDKKCGTKTKKNAAQRLINIHYLLVRGTLGLDGSVQVGIVSPVVVVIIIVFEVLFVVRVVIIVLKERLGKF